MFDAGKTRMIGLPYSKKMSRYVKPFSSHTGTSRTDGRTDRIAISISRVSVLTRDKNIDKINKNENIVEIVRHRYKIVTTR